MNQFEILSYGFIFPIDIMILLWYLYKWSNIESKGNNK